MSEPSIDLLIATIGRTKELSRLLDSLEAQTYRDFRAIIVDQNADSRVEPIVARYREAFPIELIRVPPVGKSHALNVGLGFVSGDAIGFPDDDCWYPPELLENVDAFFRTHPDTSGLSGRTTDAEGKPTQLRWDSQSGPVTRCNLFRRTCAATTFYRRAIVEAVGSFDESFGLRVAASGDILGACEESDHLLRALDAGFTQVYDPRTVIFHNAPRLTGRIAVRRSYSYGLDHSRFLRRHHYPLWFVAWRATQLVAAGCLFLVLARPAQARFYWAMARGRIRGMFLAPDQDWAASGRSPRLRGSP